MTHEESLTELVGWYRVVISESSSDDSDWTDSLIAAYSKFSEMVENPPERSADADPFVVAMTRLAFCILGWQAERLDVSTLTALIVAESEKVDNGAQDPRR